MAENANNTQSEEDIGEFTSTAETENVPDAPPGDDSATTWADVSANADDSQDPPTQDTPRAPVPLPDALSHLYRAGTRFKKALAWNVGGERPKLVKNLSVYFSVDTIVSSQEILEAFDKAGIDIDEITCIQRKASNKTWIVTFDSPVTKEDALEVAAIEIGGVNVFLGDCENRLILVKMYEAPAELPDTALIGRLTHYGRVLSFRRDKIADCIGNGVRTARMRLHRHIPSSINIAGEFIRVWYPTQPKTCRNCGAEDHIAKDCASMRCFNCERPGHHVDECGEPSLCSVCKDADHQLNECPYVLYSANVDEANGKKGEAKEELKAERKRKKQEEKQRQEQEERKQQEQRARAESEKSVRREQHANEDGNQERDRRRNDRRDGEREDQSRDQQPQQQRRRQSSERRELSERERREAERREEERREKRDRRAWEEWKEEQRRERDREEKRDDKRYEREYSRRDYARDRSSRRDSRYSDDEDGWTVVSRRRRRYDYD